MTESNGPPAPSPAPGFSRAFDENGHNMLVNFRDAVLAASYPGEHTPAVAMGLNFLASMISQLAAPMDAAQQAGNEKEFAQPAASSRGEQPNG